MPQRPWYCASRHGRVGRRQVFQSTLYLFVQHSHTHHTTPNAGWSSPVARQAHNLKVISSNLVPATKSSPKINILKAAAEPKSKAASSRPKAVDVYPCDVYP